MKASKEKMHSPQADCSASAQRSTRRARTYRSASGRPVAAVVWAGSAGTLCWLAASGETQAVMDAAPWLVLVSWFIYVGQWRPCLRADNDGFELVNGLRDHRIPFDTVEDVEVRYAVSVRAAGKKYVSWGAPTPPSSFGPGFEHVSDLKSRPHSILPGNERISQKETKTGRDAIVAAWQNARTTATKGPTGAVISSWHLPTVIVGGVAVAWAILSAFD